MPLVIDALCWRGEARQIREDWSDLPGLLLRLKVVLSDGERAATNLSRRFHATQQDRFTA